MALKVLMMGGRRCGKTSILSSMFNQAIHGPISNTFTFNDETKHVEKDGEEIDNLGNKCLELQNLIDIRGNKTFLADENPTRNYWDYTLRLKIPGKDEDMEMQFRDCPGEAFDPASIYYNEIINYTKDCDVFIVTVDTPYLMAGSKVVKEAANIPGSIHTFLSHIKKPEAQVIFVPVKCEKWMKEGQINDVVKGIVNLYRNTLNELLARPKGEVSIIPVQTAGDIVFKELREPYLVYNGITKEKIKCAKEPNDPNVVILRSGERLPLTKFDHVNQDPDGIFVGTKIIRPTAWYSLWNKPKAEFNPQNCDQIVTHILRFMFNKVKGKGFLADLLAFIFGGIGPKDMKLALKVLDDSGLIKNNVDGIKIVKSSFLDIDPDEHVKKLLNNNN